jgi:hypothetical protein
MENLGIFYDHLVYFTVIANILWTFGIFCGHLEYFMVIWYISPRFGILYKEKSGNPADESKAILVVTLVSVYLRIS